MSKAPLTPIQKLALINAVDLTADERASILPGQYPVAFTVAIEGEVAVLDDGEYTPTSKVALIPTVALALKRMGIQRENFLATFREVMGEVLAGDATMRSALVEESGLAAAEKSFRATLATLPKAKRAGRTEVDVSVEARTHEPTEE